MIDHVGIYGSRVAEGLSAFSVGLVQNGLDAKFVSTSGSEGATSDCKVGIMIKDRIFLSAIYL